MTHVAALMTHLITFTPPYVARAAAWSRARTPNACSQPLPVLQNDDASWYSSAVCARPLLTAEEERELGRQIQRERHLQTARQELQETLGRKPTLGEWAASEGISSKELKSDLEDGRAALVHLVEANLRLVRGLHVHAHARADTQRVTPRYVVCAFE